LRGHYFQNIIAYFFNPWLRHQVHDPLSAGTKGDVVSQDFCHHFPIKLMMKVRLNILIRLQSTAGGSCGKGVKINLSRKAKFK